MATKPKTIVIRTTDLNVGDIVHFHGARFEIYNTTMFRETEERYKIYGPVMVAMGKWLDGAIVNGYFGPNKDWNFQGNKNASVCVEMKSYHIEWK